MTWDFYRGNCMSFLYQTSFSSFCGMVFFYCFIFLELVSLSYRSVPVHYISTYLNSKVRCEKNVLFELIRFSKASRYYFTVPFYTYVVPIILEYTERKEKVSIYLTEICIYWNQIRIKISFRASSVFTWMFSFSLIWGQFLGKKKLW